MPTRLIQVDPREPSEAALSEAASVLLHRGLVAFATETVYGLGALAADPVAVERIFAAKGRPAFNPLIVHVAGIDQASHCVSAWPEAADRLARTFWPGPLTLVLPRSSLVPDAVTGGRDTVALRVPATPVALGLIARVGQPLAAPSANRSNRLSPTRAGHVLADLTGRIDLVLDSGPTAFGLESTVLDLTAEPFRILRPGPVQAEELVACLAGIGQVQDQWSDQRVDDDRPAPAPGMLPVHYAPCTPALRVDSISDLARIRLPVQSAVIGFGPHRMPDLPAGTAVTWLRDPADAARRLYAVLHDHDVLGLNVIVVVLPPDEPAWRAIRDRLLRATKPAGA